MDFFHRMKAAESQTSISRDAKVFSTSVPAFMTSMPVFLILLCPSVGSSGTEVGSCVRGGVAFCSVEAAGCFVASGGSSDGRFFSVRRKKTIVL